MPQDFFELFTAPHLERPIIFFVASYRHDEHVPGAVPGIDVVIISNVWYNIISNKTNIKELNQ
jgi:hypothetical protein